LLLRTIAKFTRLFFALSFSVESSYFDLDTPYYYVLKREHKRSLDTNQSVKDSALF